MVTLDLLWLPIVLSAAIVFVVSSIVWMVLPHHRNDTRALPDEAAALDALGKQGLTPRTIYRFPFVSDMKLMKEPAFQEKLRKGPTGLLTVFPGDAFNMGKPLTLWFIFLLVVSTLVAYLTGRALPPGTHYLHVFRVAGTAAILAYAAGPFPGAIWWGRPWNVTWKEVADGVVYGLLTAGTFGWLWPR